MTPTLLAGSDVRHLLLDMQQMKVFSANPLIIREARGVYLTDVDGKRYIDGVSGIYVVNIGHGNEHVIEAIRKQQERVSFVAPLHAVSDTTVRFAKKLTEITPDGLNTIKLFSGGSEATESAIKFARQYHRQSGNPAKYKVIANYLGYHGGTMGAMSASGLGGPRKAVFGPFLTGFVHIPPPSCFPGPFDLTRSACSHPGAAMLEYTVQHEGPESVAAFILEPISNTGGLFIPTPEYFQEVREVCSRYDVLMIYDEIITGMGRTGNWFAAQTFGVAPDILCIGKGLASGYAPLAGMVVRDELHYSAFWGEESRNISFAHGHTFGGNPIAAAAGLAVIEVMEKENLIPKGEQVGRHIRRRLQEEIGALGILGEVRGKGALTCVEFVENMDSGKPFAAKRRFGKKVEKRSIQHGLILRCDPHWISMAPPLTMTVEQADEMIDVFVKAVGEELREGS